MLNVPDLERRWKRYRRSKRIPYVLGGAVASLTLATAIYFLFSPIGIPHQKNYEASVSATTIAPDASQHPVNAETSPVQASSPQIPSEASDSIASQHLADSENPAAASFQAQHVTKQPAKLTPSMNFMNDFESDVMDYYFDDVTPAAQKENPKPEPKPAPVPESRQATALPSITPQSSVPPAEEVVLSTPAPKKEATVPTVQEATEPNQMLIQRDDDMKDIQDVISRFKKNKNPALSLFVAKRYYKIGNYQQAYNYALITNELDNNIEDSWLIFAKSLYKLDQKDMAIKTLKAYIQESGSVKAKITLDQMEKGTF